MTRHTDRRSPGRIALVLALLGAWTIGLTALADRSHADTARHAELVR